MQNSIIIQKTEFTFEIRNLHSQKDQISGDNQIHCKEILCEFVSESWASKLDSNSNKNVINNER